MSSYARLYIDFDGVICDSVHEAFVSSYLAYHHLSDISVPDQHPEQRALFYRYRPFIRSGQHFMLLQHCIAHSTPLSTQDDFEQQLSSTTEPQLLQWRAALYEVRGRLIERQLAEYINLHTFYPHLPPHLPALSLNPAVYILSTKKIRLISLLLASIDITWPRERMLLSHHTAKIDIIKHEHAEPAETAVFIDDHAPHILTIAQGRSAGIDCYLADWGYVLADWQQDSRYMHVDGDSLHKLIQPFLHTNK